MALARFLQLSDLHLGRPFGWLPPDKRDRRRREQRSALELAVRTAIERGAHAILIPGDLFDSEGVDSDTLLFALHAFEVNGCPPVYVAPGNHDPYSPASHYWNPRLLRARGWTWPDHVHVFDTPHWSAKPVESLEDVRVWGRCCTSGVDSTERPLAEGSIILADSADARGLEVAVFHGSLEGRCPPGQKITGPFSEREIVNSPFGYHAVGHYHVPSRIEQRPVNTQTSTASRGASGTASAGVRLAYAGSAVALTASEAGSHGALEVRIEFGHRLPFVEVEPIELDRRHVFELNAESAGAASAEQLDRRVQKALDEAGVGEHDIATVRLRGRAVHGVRYAGPGPEMRSRYFHLRVDVSGLRPDYDLEAYRRDEPRTTEARFARALLEQMSEEKDAESRALLESALYYGLDAFQLREVTPAYEEIAG